MQGFWGLVMEVWGALALAGGIGIAAGWAIWGTGKPSAEAPVEDIPEGQTAMTDIKARLAKVEAQAKENAARVERRDTDLARKDAKIKALEAEADSLRGELAFNPPPEKADDASD